MLNNLLGTLVEKYKSTIFVFLLILFTGYMSYQQIPKESDPEIVVPIVGVDVVLNGVSPEDSEKLILKPLESKLKNVKNVKNIISTAGEGYGYVEVQFIAGSDIRVAIEDVKSAVDLAKPDLPRSAEEPMVTEYASSVPPVYNFSVYGNVDERVLNRAVDELQERIRSIKEVLKVDVTGKREEIVEVTIRPEKMELYNLRSQEIFTLFENNNQLIPAGTMSNTYGNMAFTIKGSVDNLSEILEMPIKKTDKEVIKFQDVANISRVYDTETSISRLNGEKTISLSVQKRSGENIFNTVQEIKKLIEEFKKEIPESIHIKETYDDSIDVQQFMDDLESSIFTSVVLVFVVILAALGFRNSVLVGIAIPSAFFMAILYFYLMDYSLNLIILFALIMSIGMLVDGAIVVSEYADKRMQEGYSRKEAFKLASQRMAIPIISSTLTTLASFIPLLWWPGDTGQYMYGLPLTLIVTLTASIVVSLVFIPTIGSVYGKQLKVGEDSLSLIIKNGEYAKLKGMEKLYYYVINYSVNNVKKSLLIISVFCISIIGGYIFKNAGTLFFPDLGANSVTVYVANKGDYSLEEKLNLMKSLEEDLIKNYSQHAKFFRTNIDLGDYIGSVKVTLKNWKERPHSNEISDEIREKYANYRGLNVTVEEPSSGPTSGKELEIEISSNDNERLTSVVLEIDKAFKNSGYLVDVENELPSSGFQWNFSVNREKATLYGTSTNEVGTTLQMLTNGIKIGELRPADLKEEIDIRVRYPKEERNINTLNTIKVNSDNGLIPLQSIVDIQFVPKVTQIRRQYGMRSIKIGANMKEGILLSDKEKEIREIVKTKLGTDGLVKATYVGDQEEEDETTLFLEYAAISSLLLMFLMLLVQFNSYRQVFITMSAIIFSTVGVLGLLLILNEPFGIVMGGIGVIALAGIVINNNIILIDAFNERIAAGEEIKSALIKTGLDRLRPVFLTTITTVLGLLPMAFKLNIDLFTGTWTYNSPTSQLWYQLSYSIMGGISFAFFVTLVITPCLLLVSQKRKTN